MGHRSLRVRSLIPVHPLTPALCSALQATQYFRMVDLNFTGTMDKKEFSRVLKEWT
jgi:hypothetical protein